MGSHTDFPEADSHDEQEQVALERERLLMLTRSLWLISGGIGALMFIGSVAFDYMLLQHRETPAAILVSNGLVALLAAALVFTLLSYGREQRRRILERLETLNEVNHHIRNALQSLAFAAGALRDRKEGPAISEAITRIQWALREVLPKVEPNYEPFEGSARKAVQEQKALRRD
ncbi:MAG: hypothetical protein ACR2IF_06305 [Terriglobales bacterium]